MKLCQKCVDELRKIGPDTADEIYWKVEHVVVEPSCEFWAHKELNEYVFAKIFKRRVGFVSEDEDPRKALRERGDKRLQDSTIITDLTPQEQAAKLKHERERFNPR